MPRILGIDYGRKRIGVAVADDAVRIATPLKMIPGRNDPTRDARNLADLAHAEQAEAFVVGLPISMDGTDSEQTEFTRKFAAELQRLSQKPVHLHDERLSSFAADEVLDQADVTKARRKELLDQIAAQKILQSFLDQS
ncbi:MAG: Holliday junction resolvase RuvX [Planctomycetes bacterium]|nr:Holliday junction resolvase RuvX [Planctomycetota bacterium]